MNKKQIPKIIRSHLSIYMEQDCACPSMPLLPRVYQHNASTSIEDDCACPVPSRSLRESDNLDLDAVVQIAPDLHHQDLPDENELFFNPNSTQGVFVLNAPACILLNAFSKPTTINKALQNKELRGIQKKRATIRVLLEVQLLCATQ
jgi:hypothetical protein